MVPFWATRNGTRIFAIFLLTQVRTTHVTGTITDIGSTTGRAAPGLFFLLILGLGFGVQGVEFRCKVTRPENSSKSGTKDV